MKIQIIIATHKECPMPADPLYLPVHAGAQVHSYALPYTADNTGDNISAKNATFCELTALYWAWKNLDADYLGLCHYRRFFSGKTLGKKEERILTLAQAEKLMDGKTVYLPRHRNYFIETNYTQYLHAHHEEDLTLTRQILAEKDAPDGRYLKAYDALMARTTGHRFNMMIMPRDTFRTYCAWLFDVLFELEARLDISTYDAYASRVHGFIGERLLDVWLEANQIPTRELPYIFIGSENWPVKIFKFLKRKFTAKR